MYKFEADFKMEKLKFSIFDKQIDFCFCSKTKAIYSAGNRKCKSRNL